VAFLDRGQVAYFGPVSGLEQSKHPGVQAFLRMDRLDFSAESLHAVD
jgi:ABC-type transporter Mla maintaining outer membrane lipid asymmetry ATPase subunit MlaF